MKQFRSLMILALTAGLFAGLFLFSLQHLTIVPLIQEAETYESAAHHGTQQQERVWQPAEGRERTIWTAITTVLTSIGFAAILFGSVALTRRSLSVREGALWGLAAFTCFVLAPALGLPPKPPGVMLADLPDRQIWWLAAVTGTAIGLWLLIARNTGWPRRLLAVACIALPQMIGAPAAPPAEQILPSALIREFTIMSILSAGLFWLVLGTLGGLLRSRLSPDQNIGHDYSVE